jgi:taurine transport system substrate-binding protein
MALKSKLGGAVGLLALMGAFQPAAAEELTVAYFLEWPMPFQYAKAKGLYDEALGMKVNWVSFDTGTAMSAAMASGDVQIAVSQGVPPFVVATSAGQDLQIVDVAVATRRTTTASSPKSLKSTRTAPASLRRQKGRCSDRYGSSLWFLEADGAFRCRYRYNGYCRHGTA